MTRLIYTNLYSTPSGHLSEGLHKALGLRGRPCAVDSVASRIPVEASAALRCDSQGHDSGADHSALVPVNGPIACRTSRAQWFLDDSRGSSSNRRASGLGSPRLTPKCWLLHSLAVDLGPRDPGILCRVS